MCGWGGAAIIRQGGHAPKTEKRRAPESRHPPRTHDAHRQLVPWTPSIRREEDPDTLDARRVGRTPLSIQLCPIG